jgi:hypothetical protein
MVVMKAARRIRVLHNKGNKKQGVIYEEEYEFPPNPWNDKGQRRPEAEYERVLGAWKNRESKRVADGKEKKRIEREAKKVQRQQQQVPKSKKAVRSMTTKSPSTSVSMRSRRSKQQSSADADIIDNASLHVLVPTMNDVDDMKRTSTKKTRGRKKISTDHRHYTHTNGDHTNHTDGSINNSNSDATTTNGTVSSGTDGTTSNGLPLRHHHGNGHPISGISNDNSKKIDVTNGIDHFGDNDVNGTHATPIIVTSSDDEHNDSIDDNDNGTDVIASTQSRRQPKRGSIGRGVSRTGAPASVTKHPTSPLPNRSNRRSTRTADRSKPRK